MKKPFCLFSKKTKKAEKKPESAYDIETEKPIIRASVCSGERVAGFKNKKTGAFREVMLIRDNRDLDSFLKTYGLDRIDTEY